MLPQGVLFLVSCNIFLVGIAYFETDSVDFRFLGIWGVEVPGSALCTGVYIDISYLIIHGIIHDILTTVIYEEVETSLCFFIQMIMASTWWLMHTK